MYGDVLLATDDSECAAAAADEAIALAREFDATLHALAVVETRTAYDNAIVEPEIVRQNLAEECQQAIDTVRTSARDAGVDVVSALREGVPHDEILDYADESGVDVIVLGTVGRSAFKRLLLGSVAETVVRSARIPILLVPDPERPSRVNGA